MPSSSISGVIREEMAPALLQWPPWYSYTCAVLTLRKVARRGAIAGEAPQLCILMTPTVHSTTVCTCLSRPLLINNILISDDR